MSVLSTRPSTMTERRFDGSEVPGGTAAGASMWPWHRMSQAEAAPTQWARSAGRLYVGLDHLEAQGTEWLARHGILLLRLGLGTVFLWFGVLKFFPDTSPAQDLAGRTIDTLTFGLIPPQVSLLPLAATETLIGLGLISGIWLRATLLVLLLQMLGTLTPLVLFPVLTFAHAPYAPTMEGQYILKNIVLVAAALTIGATVRGGRLVSHPVTFDEPVALDSQSGLGPVRGDDRGLRAQFRGVRRSRLGGLLLQPSAEGLLGRRGGGRGPAALTPRRHGWLVTARTARMRT